MPTSISVADIKQDVLIPLMRGDGSVALYGEDSSVSSDAEITKAQFYGLFLQAPVSRLSEALSVLTAELAKTNPKNIIDAQSHSKVSPVEVLEIKIKYQDGCKAFDARYESTQAQVGLVRRLAGLYEELIKRGDAEIERLQAYVEAGQEFLEVYAPAPGFALARLDARIQELTVRLAGLRQEQSQMIAAVAGCAELLDLFDRLPEGLVSQWLAERQTPMAGYQVGDEMMARAVAAFNSLYQAMSGLTNCVASASAQERAVAVARVQQIAADCGLVETDIFRLRNGKLELRREVRGEGYTDPVSGLSWRSNEKAPEWLEGVDLRKYLVPG